MYQLHILFPDDPRPRHVESVQSASETLNRISELLKEHHGCETIVVFFGNVRLFSVDCKGNTVPG